MAAVHRSVFNIPNIVCLVNVSLNAISISCARDGWNACVILGTNCWPTKRTVQVKFISVFFLFCFV